jgi:hypothetical protein
MRISTVAGIGSAASLLAGIGVPIAFQHVQPWVGQYLLIAAGFLFALMLGLWWAHKHKDTEGGGTTVATGGPDSPGFGIVHGNVTFNARALSRHPTDGVPLPTTRRREEDERCPEMPIWKAIQHVSRIIGENDSTSYPRSRQAIRQAALEGQLVVWGRKEIPPAHLKAPQGASSVRSKIAPEYWHDYELTSYATVERFEDDDNREHTWNEGFRREIGGRYWGLRVRAKTVKRLWQEPPRPTPPPTIPPLATGWNQKGRK